MSLGVLSSTRDVAAPALRGMKIPTPHAPFKRPQPQLVPKIRLCSPRKKIEDQDCDVNTSVENKPI